MDLKITERTITIQYLKLGNEEYALADVIDVIEDLIDDYDRFNYGINDYNILSEDVADKLVELGYVEKFKGERMSTKYRVVDINKLEEILDFCNDV